MKSQVPICQSPGFAVYSRSLFPLECCVNLENKLPNIALVSPPWFNFSDIAFLIHVPSLSLHVACVEPMSSSFGRLNILLIKKKNGHVVSGSSYTLATLSFLC